MKRHTIPARNLVMAIETTQSTDQIAYLTSELIISLGGRPDLASRDAGAAALYIVALLAGKGDE